MQNHEDGSFTCAYVFEGDDGLTLVWLDTPTNNEPDQGYYMIPYVDGMKCSGQFSMQSTKYTLLPAGPIDEKSMERIRKHMREATPQNKLKDTFTGVCSCPTCRLFAN